MNGKHSRAFALSWYVRQVCFYFTLCHSPAGDEVSIPGLRGIAVPGGARSRISAFADDVSIIVSCRSDIEMMQKLTGIKINRSMSSGLPLSAWMVTLFRGLLVGLTDPSAFLEFDSSPGFTWKRIGQKYRQMSERRSELGPKVVVLEGYR